MSAIAACAGASATCLAVPAGVSGRQAGRVRVAAPCVAGTSIRSSPRHSGGKSSRGLAGERVRASTVCMARGPGGREPTFEEKALNAARRAIVQGAALVPEGTVSDDIAKGGVIAIFATMAFTLLHYGIHLQTASSLGVSTFFSYFLYNSSMDVPVPRKPKVKSEAENQSDAVNVTGRKGVDYMSAAAVQMNEIVCADGTTVDVEEDCPVE